MLPARKAIGAKLPVSTCPFCKSIDVRLVFEGDDGLRSYQCHECTHTFHVTEVQLPEPEKTKASELPKENAAQAPKKR